MCELFCLSGRLPTRATFSLQAFAARGGLRAHNVDGWGLAFHDGRDVRLYREPEPAADSAWLRFIEQRGLPSRLLISHVRHATQGGVRLANTQPFVRELGGRVHVFAHNGRLDGIEKQAAGAFGRCRPVGDTDSEVAFCLLVEALEPLWRDGRIPTRAARLAVVADFAARIRMLGPANFLYSDGELTFAHGHRRTQAGGVIAPPGLWLLQRGCAVDPDALAGSGLSIEPPEAAQELALVASVPLSDEAWRPLGEGEIVVLADGQPALIGLPSSRSQT
ncbi:MAG: class II glutamine amidotransferase [Proteobacteria bacterium]|nr:class II glutamine amidotransferase [Pseudomonadota bacterium]